MLWIKSVIENPSKSEVIGRCSGDEKTEWPRRTGTKLIHLVGSIDPESNKFREHHFQV